MPNSNSPFQNFTDWFSDGWRKLWFGEETAVSNQPIGQKPTPVTKRVSLIIHNPTIPGSNGRKLNDVLGWNDPDELCAGYMRDLHDSSYGFCNYEIVERIEVDKFPVKQDGFTYTADEFVALWKVRSGFHQPDAVNYDALIEEFDMIAKVDSGAVDEFWLFAFPYGGYYESIMGGPDAFWCNAPPLKQMAHASRRFIIMGFNYERGVGEMLEAFGHRAESIMKYTFRKKRGADNVWNRFIRYDQIDPDQAEVGLMHFAPNSVRDYDWGNETKVPSFCDNWLNFPDLEGASRIVSCPDWGDGDIRAHHNWWFQRLPHVGGVDNGIAYNWWQYIVDPNLVR